ncbi:MAG: aminoacyl-tRNA hydrolase [Candidatus Fermentibacteraceae bacterium]|nr:aminoacyl-tRNA hydrolase [Candidatus Fermentibacteraceae bacterium]MBN2608783.1 aminoacyl-tRNA hydrolase [Candidatus Fermentibacteraceae bacterium]
MLEITEGIGVPESELEFEFVLSGGPGGQKVNKTSSAVVLRFDAMGSTSLPEEVKERLREVAGSSLTADGYLVIHSRTYRSQARNLDSSVRKLVRILRRAARKPSVRKPTRPTAASEKRRLDAKKNRGRLKRERSYRPPEEDQE